MENANDQCMKIQGCCLIVLLLVGSTRISPAIPPLSPETVESYQSRFPGDLTLVVYRLALRTNDQAVADAAFYNELHVLAASPDLEVSQPALVQLQDVGDEYSITWLEKLGERPNLTAHRALFERTRDVIRERLKKTPSGSAQMVEQRLLRSTVSDITCNRLELTLPRHVKAWTLKNCSNTVVAAELKRIADQKVARTNMNFVILTRQRTAFNAKAYLQPAQAK